MVKDQEIVSGSEPVLPLALLTRGRLCLVVGAGKTGCRKAQALLEAGAKVVLVAPTGGEEAAQLAGRANLEWRQRLFQPGDAEGVFLAFAATDDEQVNGAVLAACRDRAVHCAQLGGMFTIFFTPAAVGNKQDAARSNTREHARFFHSMLGSGIYLPPSQFEVAFVSAAHSDEDIGRFLAAFGKAMQESTLPL